MNRRCFIIIQMITYLCVLTCAGCTPIQHTDIPSNLQSFVEETNTLHANIALPDNNFDTLTTLSVDTQLYLQQFEYKLRHSVKTSGRNKITKQQALDDTQSLFELLQQLYGNYPLYEREFEQAYVQLQTQLHMYDTYDKETYFKMIQEAFSFIDDYHFTLNNTTLKKFKHVFREVGITSLDQTITKVGNDYYHNQKKIHQIENDIELTNYIKAVLQEDGSITYQLYIQSRESTDVVVKITFEDESEEVVMMESLYEYNDEDFSYKEEMYDDVPYISIKKMYREGEDDKQVEAFLKSAETCKKAKIAILDLRGNKGGDPNLSDEWVKRFCGDYRNGKRIQYQRTPVIDDAFINGYKDMIHNIYGDEGIDTYMDEAIKQMESMKNIIYPDDDMKASKTLLFVLQDKQTMSAAESLINQLHSVENVVFVGMPTMGALSGSSFGNTYLENSGLAVSFGPDAYIYERSFGKEYEGFEPDIWVESKDALPYILHLLGKS